MDASDVLSPETVADVRGGLCPGVAVEELCDSHEALRAERDRLRAALDRCDMVMDTAAILGLPQELPQVYKDSWAAAHIAARKALKKE